MKTRTRTDLYQCICGETLCLQPGRFIECCGRAVATALWNRDQAAFDWLAVRSGLLGAGETFEIMARGLLNWVPADTHEWWHGECNCDGHLN